MSTRPKVWLEDDGILRISYPENFHLTLDAIQDAYRQHIQISTVERPVLVYANTVAQTDYDAQEFCSSPEVIAVTTACAIVVKHSFSRILGNLFMRFHRPPYAIRLFDNDKEALGWLAGYCNEQDTVTEG